MRHAIIHAIVRILNKIDGIQIRKEKAVTKDVQYPRYIMLDKDGLLTFQDPDLPKHVFCNHEKDFCTKKCLRFIYGFSI